MFFSLDVSASDFDVENVRLIPSICQILQHDELVILVPELITTCQMT